MSDENDNFFKRTTGNFFFLKCIKLFIVTFKGYEYLITLDSTQLYVYLRKLD